MTTKKQKLKSILHYVVKRYTIVALENIS